MNLRKFVTIFFSAVLVMALAACGNNEEKNENTKENEEARIEFPTLDRESLKDDKTVAEFEGGNITGEEFARFLGVQAFLNPDIPINDLEYRKEGIKELVMKELLIDDKMDRSEAEEEAKILWEQLESLYNKKELDNAYENLNISEEDIVDTLTSLYLLQSHFSEQITDKDINELYEAAKKELTTATYTHILIGLEETNEVGEMVEVRTEEEALEKANDLYAQLMDGADMNELATEHTDDPGSVESGGTYEDSPVIQLVPEFGEALLTQEIDEIGQPVKTEFGYHIIRVESLDVLPLETVKNDLQSQVLANKYVVYLQEELPEINYNF